MATRYRYSTCLSFGEDGEPGYTEIDVTVSYRVVWGSPEKPPAYSHGGLPAEPEESSGPYTCTSCCAGTWNDDDLCDDDGRELDRDRVVAMWRSEGIPCFQVAPGSF